MNFFKYLFASILFFGITSKGLAQVKKDTLHVLLVGNSYTFFANMPRLISQISDSTNVKLIISKNTAGGARLREHWEGKKALKTKEIISKVKYDIVVLQEQSMGTIENKEEFLKYSKKLCNLIKASGAKPYFCLNCLTGTLSNVHILPKSSSDHLVLFSLFGS